ncbi:Predicted membrane protein [Phaffia rhodozyma]|uniref:Predicted membrane protein n=1 Tax=Phaffia rhodozyma TaxID=264483 RepID=A0A0F7SRR9_PHARH|nr:Predicted membrane protein [Phaffia rhodozyma]
MANASSKRITSSNQAALKRLTYTFGLTHAAHLILRFLLRPRPFFSGPSYLLTLLFLATGFAYSFLRTVGKPKRDRNGVLRGSVELEGNEGGVVEWVLDFFYFACGLQALTPLFGYKFYYLILVVPVFALYKVYTFASPLLFGRSGSSPTVTQARAGGDGAGPNGQKQEELTKTQAKKAKKMEKLERMQMNNRR